MASSLNQWNAMAWRGFRIGRRARFVAGVDDWYRLLRLPIEDARRELGMPAPRPYRRLEFAEVFGESFHDAA